MQWIAVHLPLLSLESFTAGMPGADASDQPIVLLDAHRVSVLNAAAAQAGIRLGHRRATALSLAPTLILGEADAPRDALALQAVAHLALAFTPSVLWRPHQHLVLMEVQSCLRYWGGLQRLAWRLCEALRPLGHALRWATAPTAQAAAFLARTRADTHAPMVDAMTAGPTLAARLDPLPVDLLALDAEAVAALHGMGLHTLGQLAGVPRAGLARRFGAGLLQALDQAYGRVPMPTEDWLRLPAVFDDRLELFHRADTSEQVLQGATVLLRRLVAWALGRHARVAAFVLRMHHEPRHREGRAVPAHSAMDIALAQPSADAAHLQLLLKERLARAPLAAPTLELSLHCDQAPLGAPPNAELFPTPTDEREGLTRLVERLQARLGPEQVVQLVLTPDHRVECETRQQPAQPAALQRSAVPAVAVSVDGLLPSRPAWLLPQPEPLATARAAASGLGGRPVPLWRGRPMRLLCGPERIEAGWWDGLPVRRDYHVAEGEDGRRLWIFFDLLTKGQGGWYLHGHFA